MEDFPKQTADAEKTPDKRRKRRRGLTFAETWRRYLLGEQTTGAIDSDDEDAEQRDDKAKERPTKRWFERFGKVFRSLLSIERVPQQGVSVEADERVTEVVALPEVEDNGHIDKLLPPAFTAPLNVEQKPEISYQAVSEASQPEIPLVPGVETVSIHLPENDSLELVPEFAAIASENKETTMADTTSAVSAGEVLRQRHETRLRWRVRRLKRQTKDLKTGQRDIRKQQEAFAKQLGVQKGAYERFNKVTAPRLEKSREQLRSRLETIEQRQPTMSLAPEKQLPPEPTKAETGGINEVSIELHPEKAEILNTPSPEAKPEIVLQTVERAAEQNMPIESVYERRHETKDEPTDVIPTTKKPIPVYNMSSNSFPITPVPKFRGLYDNASPQQLPPSIAAPTQETTLYHQAMKSGFWTAISLIILLTIFMFFSS